MATDRQKINEYPKMLDQLILAIDVYGAIETYEKENGELPHFCAEEFQRWREWRIKNKLERR